MRNVKLDKRLAGTAVFVTMVANMIAIVPQIATAAPDGIRPVMPMPPSLNGRPIHHREAPPTPPPASQPRAVAPVVQAPAPVTQVSAPQEPATPVTADIGSTLDRAPGASDGQIGDRLRDMVTSKQFDRRVANANERKAIEKYYAARRYAPQWIHDGRLTASAKTAIARLKNASADALDAADYPVAEFAGSADALAAADVQLTHSVMTFARHLAVGRIAPTRVSAEVDYGDHTPDPAEILKKVLEARDVNAALDSYEPPTDRFRALKAKLAELRSNAPRADADERIAGGAVIKPGAKDPRVPQLRERLNVTMAAAAVKTMQVRDKRTGRIKLVKLPQEDSRDAALVYDKALYNAIKHVQASAALKPTGVIDNHTIAAINGPTQQQKIDSVAANMERWRWLPRDLGRTYVMVNIPDYTLRVMHDDKLVWNTKIVAGKPQTPTPLLTAAMDNVIVNPSWYVPQSIIQNEYLPLYASDPHIFERLGLEVKRGPDGHINVVQPPGAANALGRIKFNFPNKFQVYLHDTPEKRLFSADQRAFSHGCMRVENPTKFGEIMLHLAMNGATPDSRQIERLVGQEEKTFKLEKRPLVHLTYQTAYVDDDGKLVLRNDIYGFDARIHAILHSDERRIADIAPPKDPKRDAATDKSNQEILARVERREVANPFQFFEKLFR